MEPVYHSGEDEGDLVIVSVATARNDRNEPIVQLMCRLMFVNETGRRIVTYWFAEDGHRHPFILIEPGASVSINSYTGHSWLSNDAVTGQAFLMNNVQCFLTREMPFSDPDNMVFRQVVRIRSPVFNLEELAVESIVSTLTPHRDPEALKLPNILKKRVQTVQQMRLRIFEEVRHIRAIQVRNKIIHQRRNYGACRGCLNTP